MSRTYHHELVATHIEDYLGEVYSEGEIQLSRIVATIQNGWRAVDLGHPAWITFSRAGNVLYVENCVEARSVFDNAKIPYHNTLTASVVVQS